MQRLLRYYYLVGVPVALLAVCAVVFYDTIQRTLDSNPHPQINYIIFVLIIGGCALMLMHIRRINREGALLSDFVAVLKKQTSRNGVNAQRWLTRMKQTNQADVLDVLERVLDLQSKPIGAVQHASLESEITHFQARLQRRLLLAQYLSGLMVGMGLFGTFIGLLGALEEIGLLIGSFSIGPGMSDPIAAVTELVARLTAPMKAMGVAFSASLFGVLGSMIMGMLMVFVKGASAELLSILQSRVAWMTDIADESGFADLSPLQDALSELAQHSPLLQGLTVALDQSERRVRQLVTGMQELTTQVQQAAQTQGQTLEILSQQNQVQQNNMRTLDELRLEQQQARQIQERAEQRHEQGVQIMNQLNALMQETLARQAPVGEALFALQQTFTQQAQAQNDLWQKNLLSGQQLLQENLQQHTQQTLDNMQQHTQRAQENLQLLAQHMQQTQQQLAEQLAQHSVQQSNQQLAQNQHHQEQQTQQQQQEREQWAAQLQNWVKEQQLAQLSLIERMLSLEQGAAQQRALWQQQQDNLRQEQTSLQAPLQTLGDLLQQTTLQLRDDHQQRHLLMAQTRQSMQEQQLRHEQLMHILQSRNTGKAG